MAKAKIYCQRCNQNQLVTDVETITEVEDGRPPTMRKFIQGACPKCGRVVRKPTESKHGEQDGPVHTED